MSSTTEDCAFINLQKDFGLSFKDLNQYNDHNKTLSLLEDFKKVQIIFCAQGVTELIILQFPIVTCFVTGYLSSTSTLSVGSTLVTYFRGTQLISTSPTLGS